MSDDKNKKIELTTDVLLADVMLRITALETLLIEKKFFSQEELAQITDDIAKRVAKVVLEKANVSTDLDDFISKLENDNKKTFNN